MSFSSLKRDDLYKLANEDLAVPVDETATKAQIIAAIAESDITWAQAKALVPSLAGEGEDDPEEVVQNKNEAAPEEDDGTPPSLLIMERENPTFEIRGYKFTKTHPFVLVKEPDADWISANVEGFRYATPREAAEYYS